MIKVTDSLADGIFINRMYGPSLRKKIEDSFVPSEDFEALDQTIDFISRELNMIDAETSLSAKEKQARFRVTVGSALQPK